MPLQPPNDIAADWRNRFDPYPSYRTIVALNTLSGRRGKVRTTSVVAPSVGRYRLVDLPILSKVLPSLQRGCSLRASSQDGPV